MPLKAVSNSSISSRNIWRTAVVAIATTASIFLIAGWLSYRTQEIDARERLTSKARLVQAQVAALERNIDATLDQVISETTRTGRCDQPLMERLGQYYPEFRAITVVDPQGIIRCSSRAELAGLDRSAEDYFKKESASPQSHLLTIEKPVLGALTALPILLMHKTAVSPAGRLRFIVQVSVDLRYFDGILESLREKNQVLVVIHDSGLIISQQPDPDRFRMLDVSKRKAAFDEHRQVGALLTTHRIQNATDNVERFSAIADVVPEGVALASSGKLVVGVGETVADVYAGWYRLAGILAAGWLLLVLMNVLLATKVAKGRRHLQEEIEHQRHITAELTGLTDLLMQERDALDQHAIVSMADTTGKIIYVNALLSG